MTFEALSSQGCDFAQPTQRRRAISEEGNIGGCGRTVRETTVMISFKPEEVALCASVVDRACEKLRTDDEITRELISARILDAAEAGEHDPHLLLNFALAA